MSGENARGFSASPLVAVKGSVQNCRVGDRVIIRHGPAAGKHGEIIAKRGCVNRVRCDDGSELSSPYGNLQWETRRKA